MPKFIPPNFKTLTSYRRPHRCLLAHTGVPSPTPPSGRPHGCTFPAVPSVRPYGRTLPTLPTLCSQFCLLAHIAVLFPTPPFLRAYFRLIDHAVVSSLTPPSLRPHSAPSPRTPDAPLYCFCTVSSATPHHCTLLLTDPPHFAVNSTWYLYLQRRSVAKTTKQPKSP